YQVLRDYDPDNLLLDQARREVLEQQLEMRRLRATLERISRMRLRLIDTDQLSPLAFPIWAEGLRAEHVSSERWSDRVRRMVVRPEIAARPMTGMVAASEPWHRRLAVDCLFQSQSRRADPLHLGATLHRRLRRAVHHPPCHRPQHHRQQG